MMKRLTVLVVAVLFAVSVGMAAVPQASAVGEDASYLPLYSDDFTTYGFTGSYIPFTRELLAARAGGPNVEVVDISDNFQIIDFSGPDTPPVLSNGRDYAGPAEMTLRFTTDAPDGFDALDIYYAGRTIKGMSESDSAVRFAVGDSAESMTDVIVRGADKEESFLDGAYTRLTSEVAGMAEIYVRVTVDSSGFSWGCLQNLAFVGVVRQGALAGQSARTKRLLHEDFQTAPEGAYTLEAAQANPMLGWETEAMRVDGALVARGGDAPSWGPAEKGLTTEINQAGSMTYRLNAGPGGFEGVYVTLSGRAIMNSYIDVYAGTRPDALQLVRNLSDLTTSDFYDTCTLWVDAGGAETVYIKVEIKSVDFWGRAMLADLILTGIYQAAEAGANPPVLTEGMTPYNVDSQTHLREDFQEFYFETPGGETQRSLRADLGLLKALHSGSVFQALEGTCQLGPLDPNNAKTAWGMFFNGAGSVTMRLDADNPNGFRKLLLRFTGRKIIDAVLRFEVMDAPDGTVLQTVEADRENFMPELGSGDAITAELDGAAGLDTAWLKITMSNGFPGWAFLGSIELTELGAEGLTDAADWRYDYSPLENKWANAVTENGSMYVWIPRFTYRLAEGREQIEIRYSSGLRDDLSDGFEKHPAFTFRGSEAPGFWMAKFEAAQKGEATGEYNEETGESTLDWEAYIGPDGAATASLPVSAYFDAGRSIREREGLGEMADSHLARNSEWGAAAYLAKASGITPAVAAAAGENPPTAEYRYTYGAAASTTGNATGIYDMAGGAAEYVGAYLTDASTTAAGYLAGAQMIGLDGQNAGSLDRYASSALAEAGAGGALTETSGWDGDMAGTASANGGAFLLRGGDGGDGEAAGMFAYTFAGGITEGAGWRPVITVRIPEYEISDVLFTDGANPVTAYPATGTLTASVTVTNNRTDKPPVLVLAVYDKTTKQLVAADASAPVTGEMGVPAELAVRLDGLPVQNPESCYFKAFLWEDMTDQQPISEIYPNA